MRVAGEKKEGIGASRGGKTSKIHTLCNKAGKPLKFILTSGEQNDCTEALNLLKGQRSNSVIADKGYDTDAILEELKKSGTEAVIPSRALRSVQRGHDARKYKERNLIERLFLHMKHFRGLSTRYEKLAINYLSLVQFVAIFVLLK
jgi:transposase